MAAELLRRYPDVRITATDFDPAMVELAGETLRPFRERATVRQADATSLPFEAEIFDCVLSFIMLHHVGRWEDALADSARVLRAGGLLAVYDLVESAVTRALHRLGPSHGERLVGLDELEPLLARLPLTQIDVTPSIGLLVRFSARKR